MRDNPKPLELYRHFKGNTYQILTLARDSEDGHQVVVYQALYGSYEIYVRDLVQFMSPVDRTKYPTAKDEYRFTKVELTGQKTQVINNTSLTNQQPEQPAQSLKQVQSEQPIWEQPDSKEHTGYTDAQQDLIKESGERDDRLTSAADADYQLDPQVEAFLDADSYEEKLNILAGLHRRITDDMLQIMALTMDIELNPGSTQERYDELKSCLLMRDKFEADRRF